MKTKRTSEKNSLFRLWILLPLAVISIASLIACSNSDKGAQGIPDAPPPPPPPPPVEAVNDSVFVNVDELPLFKDGDQGLLDYLAKNTVYPVDAKEQGIQGKVIVRFVVEKDGSVSTVTVIKGTNTSLDAAAVKVVESLPKFETPGKIGGKPVRVHFMVPITFALK
jgi:periplasmic protein TonB